MARPDSKTCLFIVRYAGELATKSGKTRSAFSRSLRRNIRDALARADTRARLLQTQNRLYVLDCGFGVVSERLAEAMQQFGYQAYALRRHTKPHY